jgi:hypothetical protein
MSETRTYLIHGSSDRVGLAEYLRHLDRCAREWAARGHPDMEKFVRKHGARVVQEHV